MHLQGGNRFFFNFVEDIGFLPVDESHHLIKVLRKKVGEKIRLINGKGEEYEGKILEISKEKRTLRVKVKLLKLLRKEEIPSKKIVALIPILKGDKTEFLVEKGTELGISDFIPFTSDYSTVKPSSKLKERLEKKAINALKQSGRLYLPEIKSPVILKNFLTQISHSSFKILALPEEGISLEKLIEGLKDFKEIILISGPEGGFSKEEKKLLKEKNFVSLKISPYILRAETASLSLMSLISIILTELEKK